MPGKILEYDIFFLINYQLHRIATFALWLIFYYLTTITNAEIISI